MTITIQLYSKYIDVRKTGELVSEMNSPGIHNISIQTNKQTNKQTKKKRKKKIINKIQRLDVLRHSLSLDMALAKLKNLLS